MSQPACIFVVDDDPMIRDALHTILQNEFEVESHDSVEACQARLGDKLPDMFLLDVSLPGMDGYAFCRQLKEDAGTRNIPVSFVSAYDTIEYRLAGYEAGGEDFIVKPFAVDEVLRKTLVARRILDEKRGLSEQIQASEQLTSMVLASMDEFGLVLQFLGKVIACSSGREVAEAMLHLLKGYRLEGVVQVRVGSDETTLNQGGASNPLEISVVNHVRSMGRLFEFKSRSVHNFDHITVMLGNMPLNDTDLCGRIRDNLGMAAQGADARLQAIQTEEANQRKQAGIYRLLDSLQTTIDNLAAAHQQERLKGSTISFELQEDIARSFIHLGLTAGQERFLEDLIKRHMDNLIRLYDSGDKTKSLLERLSNELKMLTAN